MVTCELYRPQSTCAVLSRKIPGSTKAGKAVTTSTREDALTQGVDAPMFVRHVEAPNPLPNAPAIQIQSPFNLSVWEKYLHTHTDPHYAERVLNYIRHGVPIGYAGPESSRVHDNWPSVYKLRTEVESSLLYDVNRERKAGPFPYKPFANFVGSPMGAFYKKHSNKVRVIHDLSWHPEASVNTFIDDSLCTLQYISIDDAVKYVKEIGKGTLMSKIDIKDAFKHIIVNPDYWHLLGSTWNTIDGDVQFYVDLVLPFGLRSSPFLFNQVAIGLEYIMKCKGASIVEHYLDDYFTCGSSKSNECHNNVQIMIDACSETGFEVNPSMVVYPTTELEFLGIVIDSNSMELRISEQRLQDVSENLPLYLE